MVTFLSAAKKHAAQREPFQQSTPVRRSSFQLRALRKHSETIQTQMLRCPIAYTTASEVPFRLPCSSRATQTELPANQGGHHATYPFRSPRNTDRIRGDILVLSWLAS